MKKLLVYIFILIVICFSLPIIFTENFSRKTYRTSSENLVETKKMKILLKIFYQNQFMTIKNIVQ